MRIDFYKVRGIPITRSSLFLSNDPLNSTDKPKLPGESISWHPHYFYLATLTSLTSDHCRETAAFTNLPSRVAALCCPISRWRGGEGEWGVMGDPAGFTNCKKGEVTDLETLDEQKNALANTFLYMYSVYVFQLCSHCFVQLLKQNCQPPANI